MKIYQVYHSVNDEHSGILLGSFFNKDNANLLVRGVRQAEKKLYPVGVSSILYINEVEMDDEINE
jgi:hypothetical protein